LNRLARFDLYEDGDVAVARIVGEIDASNAAEVAERLVGGVSNRSRGLVVDLTATSYVDSAGVKLIFDTAERLRRRQIGFRLVAGVESFVMDVLSMTNVPEAVTVHGTVDEALSGMDAD
jgi:anti-anti-sigma factor